MKLFEPYRKGILELLKTIIGNLLMVVSPRRKETNPVRRVGYNSINRLVWQSLHYFNTISIVNRYISNSFHIFFVFFHYLSQYHKLYYLSVHTQLLYYLTLFFIILQFLVLFVL